ncbi:MAG TPA: YkgJ family cysteine cluster protein [Rectinemataceae bacterium]|nr:YkgJ family cysteine cluster protein [Rectinemataceae bacterium]
MMRIDELPLGLPPGELNDALSTLGGLYDRVGEATANFAASAGLACPPGCGRCCESFVPDMLPLEAAWMAATLLRDRPLEARALAEEGFPLSASRAGPCPFYIRDSPFHCGLYEGRPLICRLFGFSASYGREGLPSFSLCRHMPGKEGSTSRSWKGEGLASELGSRPALMSDFALQLVAIRPLEGHERHLLFDALPQALRRIYFLLQLREGTL